MPRIAHARSVIAKQCDRPDCRRSSTTGGTRPTRSSTTSAKCRCQDVLRGPRSVTAIFSSNDLGAIELLDVADRLGVRVPDDLSVVGFDNVLMAGLSRINLTTVAQPQEELARLSVATLAARVEGRADWRSGDDEQSSSNWSFAARLPRRAGSARKQDEHDEAAEGGRHRLRADRAGDASALSARTAGAIRDRGIVRCLGGCAFGVRARLRRRAGHLPTGAT